MNDTQALFLFLGTPILVTLLIAVVAVLDGLKDVIKAAKERPESAPKGPANPQEVAREQPTASP